MKRIFLIGLAVAALAACSLREGGAPVTPAGSLALDAALVQRDTAPHAACSPPAGLTIPVAGAPAVNVAYGQLVEGAKGNYAFTGVTFVYPPHRHVFAATNGVATLYKKFGNFGPTIVVTAGAGAQTLYTNFASTVVKFSKKHTARVKAGQPIALSGSSPLLFEYAPAGNIGNAGAQSNPCGTQSGATASIGIMPAEAAVLARFHSLSVNGTPVPAGPDPTSSPDVSTPAGLSVANVDQPATLAATMYEGSDVFSSYYIVLCGNAVFKTGSNPRVAGPFTYTEGTTSIAHVSPSPLPQVVFFRDAGVKGSTLTADLPGLTRGCPATPPANLYAWSSPVFFGAGQTEWVRYVSNGGSSGDTVTFTSSQTSVISASPSPLAVFATAPPAWPPPSPRADLTSGVPGTAIITVFDTQSGQDDSPINVQVNATPSAAPVPSPLPNN